MDKPSDTDLADAAVTYDTEGSTTAPRGSTARSLATFEQHRRWANEQIEQLQERLEHQAETIPRLTDELERVRRHAKEAAEDNDSLRREMGPMRRVVNQHESCASRIARYRSSLRTAEERLSDIRAKNTATTRLDMQAKSEVIERLRSGRSALAAELEQVTRERDAAVISHDKRGLTENQIESLRHILNELHPGQVTPDAELFDEVCAVVWRWADRDKKAKPAPAIEGAPKWEQVLDAALANIAGLCPQAQLKVISWALSDSGS